MKSVHAAKRGTALHKAKRDRKLAELQVPEIAQHEREAAAFWHRRIATSLLIGNGAGVVAVGGFLGKAETVNVAAPIVYPALALFLTGVAFGFVNLFISLIWSASRIDAYVDFFTKMEAIRKQKYVTDEGLTKNTIFGIATILFCLQFACLLGAGASFYLASAQVVIGLGRIACTTEPSAAFCENKPSFMFEDPVDRYRLNSMSEPISKFVSKPTFVTHARTDGTNFDTVDRLILRPRGTQPTSTSAEYTFRLVRTGPVHGNISCTINIVDWFISGDSPFTRNPKTAAFLNHAAKQTAQFRLEPQFLSVSIRHVTDNEPDFTTLEWDVTDHSLFAVEPQIGGRGDVRGLPDPQYQGGLLLIETPNAQSKSCLRLGKAAGFGTVN
jgi:hypothetical protein